MSRSAQLGYLPGIDWLRSIFSVAIVTWHLGSAGMSLLGDQARYQEHVFTLSDLINFHFLLLGVPIFFLVSCYLYAMKDRTARDLRKRIIRLGFLTLVWGIAFRVWFLGSEAFRPSIPESFPAFFWFVLSGGQTLYYFLVSLIFVTLITHIVQRWPTLHIAILFSVACFSLPFLAAAAIANDNYFLSAYYNPLNFLPYPFAAILILRIQPLIRQHRAWTIWMAALLIIGVLFSFVEWKYHVHEVFIRAQPYAFPPYTRGSNIFFSIFFFSLALTWKIRRNRIICFMSEHSLPLYCLHPFFLGFSVNLLAFSHISLPAFPGEIIKIAIVLSCCYLISAMAKQFSPRMYNIFLQGSVFNVHKDKSIVD